MSTRILKRQLTRHDESVRKSVLVVLYNETAENMFAKVTTDDQGKVEIDVSTAPTGIYRIEYYGDGLDEDDWEENIALTNYGTEFDKIPPEKSQVGTVELEQ